MFHPRGPAGGPLLPPPADAGLTEAESVRRHFWRLGYEPHRAALKAEEAARADPTQ